MMEAQPHPIALKLHLTVVSVIVPFHHRLGVQQPLFDFSKEFIPGHQLFVHCRHSGLPLLIGQQGRWVATIDHLERGSVQGRLQRRVVAEFRPR
jgi:hypothetical protein